MFHWAIFSFLGLSLAFFVSANADTSPSKRLTTLASQCRFSIGEHNYNLCPLFESKKAAEWSIHLKYPTPPTETYVQYRIGLDGPLKPNATLPAHEQCAEGTWVCMTTINRRPDHRSEAPRITQLIPVVSNGTLYPLEPHSHSFATSNSAAQREKFGIWALEGEVSREDAPRPLLLRMHGGYYVDRPQRAVIAFHCGQTEDPEPTYAWTWNGTHWFNWNTKHACASQRAKPLPSPAPDKSDKPPSPPSTPPPDSDTPSEGELLPAPVAEHASPRTVLTILLCTFTGLFGLGYLLLRPPARLRPYVHRILPRPLRRASESKLLRWAREDLPLLDDDVEEEEDEMVNAHDAYGGAEEQIPLKPSPTKAGFVVNYGAAGGKP